MESEKKENSIELRFTMEEALVFFDWVSKVNSIDQPKIFEDQAENRILWDIESCLERVLSDTFDENYLEILKKARLKLRD